MKFNKLSKFAIVAALGAVCALSLSACGTEDKGELKTDTGLTGGVAAKVNDYEIEEDKVTRAINNMRIANDLTSDEEWKKNLTMYGNTVESMRYTVLGQFIEDQLVRQCAENLEVTTDDEEIASYVEKMSSQYSSNEKWLEAVDKAGWESEDKYKDSLRFSILKKKITDIYEKQAEEALADNAKLLEEVKSAISTYDGAKKTAHIQLGTDEAQAKDIYNRLNDGTLKWSDAVTEYSTDEETKGSNGNKGWDKIDEPTTTYKETIKELEVGKFSEPRKNKYGYEIVTVTDEFDAPTDVTSLDGIPSDIIDAVKDKAIETNGGKLYDEWLNTVRVENKIEVNPMPDNVPYKVDLSGDYSEEEAKKINDKALNKLIKGVEETSEETESVEAEAAGDQAAVEGGEAAAAVEGAEGSGSESAGSESGNGDNAGSENKS